MPVKPIDVLMRMDLVGSVEECQADLLWRLIDRRLVAIGRTHPIDPLLIFSTYSGSNADNWGNTATFDKIGNLYSGGMTNHVRGGEILGEFNATTGAYQTEDGGIWDVAILKPLHPLNRTKWLWIWVPVAVLTVFWQSAKLALPAGSLGWT